MGAACDAVVLCLSSHQNSGAEAPPILHLVPVLVLKKGRRRWGRPVMPSFCACPRINRQKGEGMVGLHSVPAIISAARKENSPAGAGEGVPG